MTLTTDDHDRDAAGLTYVYPVVSRRAGGVSIGVNLNPNRACNWRCIYCQVPGLQRGAGPPIDLERLEHELGGFLDELFDGDYLTREIADPKLRRVNDIALSGDGEPTSSPQLLEALERIAAARAARPQLAATKTILITNGSLVHEQRVQRALRALAELNGEVWFKFDSATEAGRLAINDERAGLERARRNTETAAALCPTWLQTCVFARHGLEPTPAERSAYLAELRRWRQAGVPLRGVLLYGLARPSHQPEAAELWALPAAWLEAFADEIRALGVAVQVNV